LDSNYKREFKHVSLIWNEMNQEE